MRPAPPAVRAPTCTRNGATAATPIRTPRNPAACTQMAKAIQMGTDLRASASRWTCALSPLTAATGEKLAAGVRCEPPCPALRFEVDDGRDEA